MTLENQVCSLELAKRLKELGVKQESLFFYKYKHDDKHYETKKYELCEEEGEFCYHDFRQENYISAFTVAELGEILPSGAKSFVGSTNGDMKNWVTEWWEIREWDLNVEKFADTEADARAKMLIYLLENKLITL